MTPFNVVYLFACCGNLHNFDQKIVLCVIDVPTVQVSGMEVHFFRFSNTFAWLPVTRVKACYLPRSRQARHLVQIFKVDLFVKLSLVPKRASKRHLVNQITLRRPFRNQAHFFLIYPVPCSFRTWLVTSR